MTIQIPDDLARGLQGLAALHRKSIEQLAVESLRQLVDPQSSPEAILRAVRSLPHPSTAAVDDLEAAIVSARLPMRDRGAFDESPQA
jgi:plasmid stability protein